MFKIKMYLLGLMAALCGKTVLELIQGTGPMCVEDEKHSKNPNLHHPTTTHAIVLGTSLMDCPVPPSQRLSLLGSLSWIFQHSNTTFLGVTDSWVLVPSQHPLSKNTLARFFDAVHFSTPELRDRQISQVMQELANVYLSDVGLTSGNCLDVLFYETRNDDKAVTAAWLVENAHITSFDAAPADRFDRAGTTHVSDNVSWKLVPGNVRRDAHALDMAHSLHSVAGQSEQLSDEHWLHGRNCK